MKNNYSLKIKILFAFLTVILIAGAVLINAIAVEMSERYPLTVDLTANSAYEIGDGTRTFLMSLEKPVEIFVLSEEGGFSRSDYLEQAKRVIDEYPRYSENISLSYIDYAADPSFAANYPELSLSHGDLLITSGEKTKHVLVANLFNYTYTQDGGLAISSSRAEEAVTSAIVNVTSEKTVKIALLSGNGVTEAKLFTALLADNNYELHTEPIATSTLEGYDMALLLAPTSDISEDAARKLESFLYNGGSYGKTLFYTASPTQGDMPVLDTYLSEWGVAFSNGAVFETSGDRTYQYQPFYPLVAYEDEKFANMLKDKNTPFLMPVSRPMEILFKAKDGYFVETLLSFSESAGVRPADAGSDFTAEDSPIWGPMPAFVLSSFNATAPDGSPLSSQVLVSSSTGIFDAVALQNGSLTNSEYLLNLISSLTDTTAAVNVESKTLAGKTLGVTSSQASFLGMLLTGIVPASILAVGIGVWFLRRYR